MDSLKRITRMSVFVYAILIISIYFLYRYDNNIENKMILADFMKKEAQYQYTDFEDKLNGIANANVSVSTMLTWYENIRFEMELSRDYEKLPGTEDKSKLRTQEDVDERMDNLFPDRLPWADKYIMPYVYTQIYYDILVDLDKNSEDYWELAYHALFSLSLHQYLLANNPYGWVYKNCKVIAFVLAILLIVVFSLNMAVLIIYYLKLLNRKGRRNEE